MTRELSQQQNKTQHIGVRSRLIRSMLVWFLLGEVVGICTAPLHLGFLGVLSGVIAGPIITFLFGLIFGLVGSNIRLTVLGSGFGASIAATAICVLGDLSNPGFSIAVGVLNGALVGATSSTICQSIAWIISKALVKKPLPATSQMAS
jgi:hypothetical protein